MPAKTDQRHEVDRPAHLDLDAAQVGRLTRPQREARVVELLAESRRIYDAALAELVTGAGKRHVGTAVLFSGGNDSTVLAHAFRGVADYAAHANTTIGVEQTRQFVRDVCEAWGLPLLEEVAPTSYADLVLERGFPGPGQHHKMFQRLKERPLLKIRADLVGDSRRDRLVFLAGRRRDESARRAGVPLWEREGSLVWVSPMAYWTKLDLNTYRLLEGDVPTNDVTGLLHMSGECLCGAFAKRGELSEIAAWFPDVAAEIVALEERVAAERADLGPERCRWGWGAYRGDRDALVAAALSSPDMAGSLCATCG